MSQRKVSINPSYFTDLLYIASCFGWSKIVKKLSQQKMISNELSDGCYPLTSAVYYGNQNVVELLLNYPKIDVNYSDSSGCTPLHISISNKNAEMVFLLYSHKANFNMKNGQDKTALDYLRKFARKGDPFVDLLINDMVEIAIADEELIPILLELQKLMLESQQKTMERFKNQIAQKRTDLERMAKESERIPVNKKQKLEHNIDETSVERVTTEQRFSNF